MSYGTEYTAIQDAAQRVADHLTAHGDSWRDHLPDGAVITNDGDPEVFDTVQLADPDGTLIYRRDIDHTRPSYWVTVGWSDASKSRRYRPIPTDLRPWTYDERDDEDPR